jgi:threonine/homoserine/homoserine lactone efflux protein
MLHTILKGTLLGLTLAGLLGPAFFSLVQTSIHRGFKSGFFLAIGIFLSDFSLIFLSYIGVSQIFSAPKNQFWVGIIGGIMLIAFGIYTFRHRMKLTVDGELVVKKTGALTYILKGYFLNIANPSVWLFWVSVVTLNIGTAESEDVHSFFAFFAAALLTVFLTDLLKCFIAFRIKIYLNDKVMKLINHIVGILLFIFGMYLIYNAILLK